MMVILVTNYTGSQPHHGCQATCQALKQMLVDRFHHDELLTEHWQSHGNRVTMYLGRAGENIRSRQMKYSDTYERYRRADLLIVNGEGSFYSKPWWRQSANSNQRLMDAYLTRRVLGKKVAIVNHTIGSRHKLYDSFVTRVYSRINYVAVREPVSLRYLRERGIDKVTQAADAVFSLPLPAPAEESPLEGKILITDSSSWRGIRWTSARRERVRSLLGHLRGQGERIVYLSIFTDRRDEHIAGELDVEYISALTHTELLSHLQSAKMVISGRYHMCVFCARCGVPFVGFEANTPKIKGVCQLLDYPVAPFEFLTTPTDVIAERVGEALHQRESLHLHLTGAQSYLHELALLNVPQLNE